MEPTKPKGFHYLVQHFGSLEVFFKAILVILGGVLQMLILAVVPKVKCLKDHITYVHMCVMYSVAILAQGPNLQAWLWRMSTRLLLNARPHRPMTSGKALARSGSNDF